MVSADDLRAAIRNAAPLAVRTLIRAMETSTRVDVRIRAAEAILRVACDPREQPAAGETYYVVDPGMVAKEEWGKTTN